MKLFRFVAVVLLALALMAFGADAIASLERGHIFMRSLTQDLALFGADPTDWLERTFPGSVAGAIEFIFSWPGWAVLGVLGLAISAMSIGTDDDKD